MRARAISAASASLLLLLLATLATVLAEEDLEAKLAQAYLAIRDAEAAGGDVAKLALSLNKAIDLLSEARKEADLGRRSSLIAEAEAIISEVLREAPRVKELGAASRQLSLALTAVGGASSIALAALAYVYVPRAVWRAWLRAKRNWVVKVRR
ncbi:MAG: hypothetical protein N3H31_04935 [Candidatus Nezhaarchaeota archaeon]|nr:hypothetical protein [Candidatus Nezhaarchaeota archaeon]